MTIKVENAKERLYTMNLWLKSKGAKEIHRLKFMPGQHLELSVEELLACKEYSFFNNKVELKHLVIHMTDEDQALIDAESDGVSGDKAESDGVSGDKAESDGVSGEPLTKAELVDKLVANGKLENKTQARTMTKEDLMVLDA